MVEVEEVDGLQRRIPCDSTSMCIPDDSCNVCITHDSINLCTPLDSTSVRLPDDSCNVCITHDSINLCIPYDSTSVCIPDDSSNVCITHDSINLCTPYDGTKLCRRHKGINRTLTSTNFFAAAPPCNTCASHNLSCTRQSYFHLESAATTITHHQHELHRQYREIPQHHRCVNESDASHYVESIQSTSMLSGKSKRNGWT